MTSMATPTATRETDDAGVDLRSRPGALVIVATALASLVCFLDANVAVAVPAIGRDLGAGVAALQWTLTGYLVTVASLLLVSGSLADHFGRRQVMITGLLLMSGAAVVCAVAPSIGVLIAARIVQGVGGALVVPSSLALLNGTLRVADRSRGIGIWAGIATLGTTTGPYLGGWLVDNASWRYVFVLNVPLSLGALAALRWVPADRQARRPLSLDVAGGLLAVLGLAGTIYALTTGSTAGWLSARVLVAAAVGVGSLAALLPVERRARSAMLRLSLFTSRQFDAINVTTVFLYGALGAASYLLVLQCELRLSYSAAQAGAVLIPSSAIFLALAPLSGILVARFGPRWLMVSGILMVAAGFVVLSRTHAGSSYAGSILPGVILWGVGIGLTVTPLTASVLAAVADADLGEATAVNDTASRLGGVVVIALVPALIGATGGSGFASALAHGYQPAMLALAALCVIAALVAGRFVSNARRAAPRVTPLPPHHGCALPIPDLATT
jgi:EmrB/QacA subfamily drug resistance transporter